MSSGTEAVGGKARALLELRRWGLPVPRFVVISEDVLARNGQDALIKNIPEELGVDTLFAVRSSAGDEDGAEHSFAGLFSTELFVRADDLAAAVDRVWKSAFSDRVRVYREARGLAAGQGLSVIVQEMVDADVSGVAFGIHPVTGERGVTVINAVFGLGEGLVSGNLPADQYEVRDTVTRTVAVKNTGYFFDSGTGQGLREHPVASELVSAPCLTDAQAREVARVLAVVTRKKRRYQDMEFAFAGGQLFVLQARPVTQVEQLPDRGGTRIVWDNSNIIESYPGITSPLTFSFIVDMYASVYRQLSDLLGIEAKVVEANADVYASLLGLLNGRVYYNLTNWHRCLALLPGYSVNADFMDRMMGVKEKFETPPAQPLSWTELRRMVRAVVHVLATYGRVERERRRFLEHVHGVLERYEGMDWSNRRLEELAADYQTFETTLLTHWKAPLVNDFFAMIFFGLLQKITPEGLHNDLVSGAGDIVSVEPVTRTREIAALIRRNQEWKQRFLTEDPEVFWNSVENEDSSIMDDIRAYLFRFGDRTVGELKLETVTYRQEPWQYLRLLRPYVERDDKPAPRSSTREAAENRVLELLRGNPLRRLLWKWILKRARYFVSHRENLRFERTRGFGMVRRIFIALGERLYAEHRLGQPRDIFFLEKREIFDYLRGKSPNQDLAGLVEYRRREYAKWEDLAVPERIVTFGGVYVGNDLMRQPEAAVSTGDLQGVGCCAGVVRAAVRILLDPREADDLEGKILVTFSTDPGWVPLFPSASGILVERGSLLSHSAIVSRELGIPCVVGVSQLMKRLADGDIVEMDGATGVVRVIEGANGAG